MKRRADRLPPTHPTAETVARMIQARTGVRLIELRPATPYPADYRAHVEQAARENERGTLPPLAGAPDIAPYATVFFGFPTWGMQLPPMKTFLSQADWRGKRVRPFNTHAGYGVTSGFETVKALPVTPWYSSSVTRRCL